MTTVSTPDDINLLLDIIPPRIRQAIEKSPQEGRMLEIVLDLGRMPEIRFPDGMEVVSDIPLTHEDIEYVVSRVGRFNDDNRAGIERTLHRISAIRNRLGTVIGITCRVGRAIIGTVAILQDVIESGKSILLLGRPGVGKTTLLRESARVLADELGKRVIIVDTSNEIGGDGDIPHPGIGRARRMQVPSALRQHAVMIEAVENHMPEVIVIDEIGTEAEALAARTIAERGVQLVATAHGNTLDNLLQNPTLADLLGGIQAVTLSDEEARRRGSRKTVLERKAPPTFEVLVEIQDRDRLAVHHEVQATVDAFLKELPIYPEIRQRRENGELEIKPGQRPEEMDAGALQGEQAGGYPFGRQKKSRIYTYGVSRERLEKTIERYHAPATVVDDPNRADLLLTIKSQEKRQPKRFKELRSRGTPLQVLRSNSVVQMENFLRSQFGLDRRLTDKEALLQETEAAISEVMRKGVPVALAPQSAHLRAIQHQLVQRAGLMTESRGKGPMRRVVIYP
ncbi:MAG: R3H domain-containing nucleic acid-binding protein [Deltaproteobacteria bacterium]